MAKPNRMDNTMRRDLPLESVLRKDPSTFTDSDEDEKNPEARTQACRQLGLSQTYANVKLIRQYMGLDSSRSRDSLVALKDESAITWDLCQTAMTAHPGKRRLVSLNEANDVARRLGEQYTGTRYFSITRRGKDDHGGAEDEEEDEEDNGKSGDDFAHKSVLSRRIFAWNISRSDEDAEKDGFEKCDECGHYHD